MSWHNYTIDGYGICIDDIYHKMWEQSISDKESVSRVWELVEKAPNFYKRFEEWVNEVYPNKEELTFDEITEWENPDNCLIGLGSILVEVLNEVTDIHFTFCDDFDGKQYIVFEPSYPWGHLTDAEKNLTPTKLDKLFKEFTGILLYTDGIGGEYQSVENGG